MMSLQPQDDVLADVGLQGCTRSPASGQTMLQRYLCCGQLRDHESCSGVSETPADPDPADKSFSEGLTLQHHDVFWPGELGVV